MKTLIGFFTGGNLKLVIAGVVIAAFGVMRLQINRKNKKIDKLQVEVLDYARTDRRMNTEELLKAELLKGDDLLKSFIDEHIPVDELVEIGFLQKEWIGDYRKISDRICQWFGYETIYEYGAKEVNCHLTLGDEDNFIATERDEPFLTTIKSVYD